MIRYFKLLIPSFAAAALAIGSAVIPPAASAQDVPSYAHPPAYSDDETIHGRIQSIDGVFNISVRDDRGYVDSIQLHQGTVINPTGLTLADGMSVTIRGYNRGSQFAANEIDTPYQYAGPAPTPVYYGAGWWYPGYAYGYGPSFSLGFFFGGGTVVRGPWHPYYYNGFAYGRPGYAYSRPGYAYGHPGYGYVQHNSYSYGHPATGYRNAISTTRRTSLGGSAYAGRSAPGAERAPLARSGGSYRSASSYRGGGGGGSARHR